VVDILLTVDIEDWFQVENFKQCIPFESWPSYELRVEQNTHRLLDLFDSIEIKKTPSCPQAERSSNEVLIQPASQRDEALIQPRTKVRATFFVLGWIAERLPNLVREIHARGHEVASHGYCHQLCTECSLKDLRKDLINSKQFLEDIIGASIYGYRAPSFSINDDTLKIIEDCGYLYDSSYNSFGMHGRYGKISLNGRKRFGIACEISHGFFELPISNLMFSLNPFRAGAWSKAILKRSAPTAYRVTLPWGGGGYFRLTPFVLFRLGVQRILKKQGAYLFYMHPWEIDFLQPRVRDLPSGYKFRHYVNLKTTEAKLVKFLDAFNQYRFIPCNKYIEEIVGSANDSFFDA
jgi:polysaccharide deacetylase family protein (PEP-CTERM system associated)